MAPAAVSEECMEHTRDTQQQKLADERDTIHTPPLRDPHPFLSTPPPDPPSRPQPFLSRLPLSFLPNIPFSSRSLPMHQPTNQQINPPTGQATTQPQTNPQTNKPTNKPSNRQTTKQPNNQPPQPPQPPQSFSLKTALLLRGLHSENLAGAMHGAREDGDGGTGSARRRRQRRLRSFLRHERMAVAMAVAERLHHSANVTDLKNKEEV